MAYMLSGILPSYFSREFSYARLRLPKANTQKICVINDGVLTIVDDTDEPKLYCSEILQNEMKI
jgi:hypothetical protein